MVTRRESLLTELQRRRHAQQWLLDFTCHTKPDYEPSWHHHVLAYYLDGFAFGEIPQLVVNLPPQRGKSELCLRRLSAKLLGDNPDERILASSYSDDLASKMCRDVQEILDTNAYRQLFPETQLPPEGSRRWIRNSSEFQVMGRRGGVVARGVGSGVGGRGFDTLILDDPFKDRKDADSKAVSESVWEWFTNVFLARRGSDKARVLIVTTRWNDRDPVGRLQKQCKDNPDLPPWTVVRFPEIAEEEKAMREDPRRPGEVLWPARYSLANALATKETVGPYTWSSVFQQMPVPRSGGMFSREYFEGKIVPEAPPDARRVRRWDKGYSSKGDPSAGGLVAIDGRGRVFIEDVVHVRLAAGPRNRVIRETAELDRHRYQGRVRIRIEKPPGAGKETTENLIRELHGFPVRAVAPVGDKTERAEALSAQAAIGNVYLVAGSWVEKFLDELCIFPNGEHDDQVDAVCGAYLDLTSSPVPGLPVAGGSLGPVSAPGIKMPTRTLEY